MADRAWVILAVGLVGCPRPVPEPPRVPPPQVWVDAFAVGPGEGSARLPLKQVPEQLASGTILHLASGLYRGPFVFSSVRVVSTGQAVLYAEEGTVVRGRDLSLEGVSVQGGTTGLVAEGPVAVTGVHFSGHRRVGVEVRPGAELSVDGGVFEGVVSDTVAIRVAGGTARVVGSQFRGAGFKRAIEAAGGGVTVAGSSFEGPGEAVHATDAVVTVRDAAIAGGQGPALFAVRGSLAVERVTVTGHEYALQTGAGTALSVKGLIVRRPLVAGVATVQSQGTLSDLDLEGSGAAGALQLLDSDLTVEGVRIAHAQALGVFVRKGTVRLRDVTIDGVQGEDGTQGDGLHLRDARVEVEAATVRDVAGSAVLASAGARVRIGRLVSERSGYGALVAERGASVEAREVVSAGTRGPAVSVPDAASVRLGRLEVTGAADVPVWVDCAQGASATVGQLVSAVAQPPSRCLEQR